MYIACYIYTVSLYFYHTSCLLLHVYNILYVLYMYGTYREGGVYIAMLLGISTLLPLLCFLSSMSMSTYKLLEKNIDMESNKPAE